MLDIFFDRNRRKNNETTLKSINNRKLKKSNKMGETIGSGTNFKADLISQMSLADFELEIDDAIQELDSIQNQFLKAPSLSTIEEYRSTVGAFLKKVVQNYQAIPHYKGIRNKIELKIFNKVNKEIDEIRNMIVAGNVGGFALLSKFNMIKGLILDLKIGK